MNTILKISFFIFLNILFLSCSQQQQNSETSVSNVSDTLTKTEVNDENEAVEEEIAEAEVMDESWKEVKIGNQVWMSTNLNVSTFRNGDPIPQAKSNGEWSTAGKNNTPAWCYYKNETKNGVIYGKLYNWYAVNDSRGLAPEGWHIPTDEEWMKLIDNLGGNSMLGQVSVANELKNTSGWVDYNGKNGNGNNQSGFSALPGLYRGENGIWHSKSGLHGEWWSATETSVLYAYTYSIYNSDDVINRNNNRYMESGLSVRCVKD
jgi:uncharacterized protein (TIGR02145 family)